MTVEDYYDTCDGGISTTDGCKLNIEKACINGIEVDLLESRTLDLVMKGNGFDSRGSDALNKSDFSDPSKMYNTVSTPGGRQIQLCTKLDGLKEEDVASLTARKLPTDKDFDVESTPALIKPGQMVGFNSLHYRLKMRDGQLSYEVELRSLENIEGPKAVGRQKRTDLAQVAGKGTGGVLDIREVLKKLFVINLVRCKKNISFTDRPEMTSFFKTISDTPEKIRQAEAEEFQKVLAAIGPSGVDKAALRSNFQRVFKVDLPVADAPDEEPKKVVPRIDKHRAKSP